MGLKKGLKNLFREPSKQELEMREAKLLQKARVERARARLEVAKAKTRGAKQRNDDMFGSSGTYSSFGLETNTSTKKKKKDYDAFRLV